MTNFIIMIVLFCFLVSSIRGRILSLTPMYGSQSYSQISMPPSPAPFARSPSNNHNVHYGHTLAPAPALTTIIAPYAKSPSNKHMAHYGHTPAPTTIIAPYAKSPSYKHMVHYSYTPTPAPAPTIIIGPNAKSPSYKHMAHYSHNPTSAPAPTTILAPYAKSPSYKHMAHYGHTPTPAATTIIAPYAKSPSYKHMGHYGHTPAPAPAPTTILAPYAKSPSYMHMGQYSHTPAPAPTTILAPYAKSPSSKHMAHYSHTPAPTPTPTLAPTPTPTPAPAHTPTLGPAPAPAPTPTTIAAPSTNSSTEFSQDKNVYDVRSFGAVGDGLTDDTEAFESAWDAACQVKNAKVVAPNKYTFILQPMIFTGPCKSGLVFQLDGTISPPDGPDMWPKKSSKKQWLIFYRTHGLTFQGGGVIDGRGEQWWNLPCKPHKGPDGTTVRGPCDSPVAIRFYGGTNLTMRGLKVINSPEFHIRFDACQTVHVDSLVIKSPANSPNTDGIHIENTNDVKIYNSLISNGDDCISIGAGSHNLDIKNVTCGPGHGISIGSLGVHKSKACVSNITVSNCLIKHSDNGVRIKTWQGGSGSVSDVTFDGIKMDIVRNPVIIDQYYCMSKNCSNQTSAVSVSSISYSNIKGTYDIRDPPVHLACSDSVPCTNITLSGLDLHPVAATDPISSHKHGPLKEPYCWNAYGSLDADTTPPVDCLLEGLPYLDLSDVELC